MENPWDWYLIYQQRNDDYNAWHNQIIIKNPQCLVITKISCKGHAWAANVEYQFDLTELNMY